MTAVPHISSFCRDCYTTSIAGARCPSCKGTRIVANPEVFDLGIAHLDCDAFYAAIEKRENPKLLSKPVIIGGGKRGVAATCCYIARTYGVHSAMPMFKALKLCPDAVVIRPRMSLYAQEGRKVRKLMRDLTPLVEPISIDEAFMDLTGTEKLHKTPPAITLAKLATRVEKDIGITVSIGLSYNKFLAKVASELEKPRGFSVLGESEALDFLKPKPVRFIYGVGAALDKKLKRDGILRIGDLQKMEQTDLMKRYGAIGSRLHDFSRGLDKRKVNPTGLTKSISAETTFEEDIGDVDKLIYILWPLCEKVSDRLKGKSLKGRTITLKAKTTRFTTISRNRTLSNPTNYAETIFELGEDMLRGLAKGEAFRLIGIGVSDFTESGPEALEMELVGGTDKRKLRAEAALDKVRETYGKNAIKKGRGLKRSP